MHIILFNERQSARGAGKTKSWRWLLLWAQRVRDDAQTGRPKTIRPALALANIGAQPGFVVINAFPRTKALESSPVLHQAELPMAVSAVIFHNFLSESHLRALSRKKAPFAMSTSRPGPRFSYKTLRAQTCATSNGNSSEESDTASWMPMSVIKITTQLYLTIYGAAHVSLYQLLANACIAACRVDSYPCRFGPRDAHQPASTSIQLNRGCW